jgi:hypothetical protein
MEDLFEEVLTDVKSFDGTTYPYYKNSNSLSDISMNDKETVRQTSKDINRLVKYVESLVTRNSKAISGDNHLGDFKSDIFDTKPQYQSLTIETMTSDNENSPESHYITLADKDPITEENFIESFQRRSKPEKILPKDPMTQLYFASLGAVGLFILYRLMVKSS